MAPSTTVALVKTVAPEDRRSRESLKCVQSGGGGLGERRFSVENPDAAGHTPFIRDTGRRHSQDSNLHRDAARVSSSNAASHRSNGLDKRRTSNENNKHGHQKESKSHNRKDEALGADKAREQDGYGATKEKKKETERGESSRMDSHLSQLKRSSSEKHVPVKDSTPPETGKTRNGEVKRDKEKPSSLPHRNDSR